MCDIEIIYHPCNGMQLFVQKACFCPKKRFNITATMMSQHDAFELDRSDGIFTNFAGHTSS